VDEFTGAHSNTATSQYRDGGMAPHKQIEYVIFDVDGLMIDSEHVYTDVTSDILAQYGEKMTWEIKAGLMGKRTSTDLLLEPALS